MGAESGIDNPNLRIMKAVNKVMPVIIFFVTINFPTVSVYSSSVRPSTPLSPPFVHKKSVVSFLKQEVMLG